MKKLFLLLTLSLLCHSSLAISGQAEDAALLDAIDQRNLLGVENALKNGANAGALYPPEYLKSALDRALSEATYPLDDDEEKILASIKVIKLLVEAGALKTQTKDVLIYPVLDNNVVLLNYLIANGAKASARVDGLSLSEYAAMYSHDEVYQILVKSGAIPVSTSSISGLRLIKAASRHSINDAQIQLSAGADINTKISDGRTPLIAALSTPAFNEDHYKMIEFLLSKGADPDLNGKERDSFVTPLGQAISWGSYPAKRKSENIPKANIAFKIIKLLITKGAKVSGKDFYGNTPLHIAARRDYVDAASFLIKEGAKVMPKNNAGKTPLDLAEGKEMIQLLKKNGAKE